MALVAFIMFFLAGLGFGYAVRGNVAWIVLAFPSLLALVAMVGYGATADVLLKLVLALLVTAAGVLGGRWLFARIDGSREPEPA